MIVLCVASRGDGPDGLAQSFMPVPSAGWYGPFISCLATPFIVCFTGLQRGASSFERRFPMAERVCMLISAPQCLLFCPLATQPNTHITSGN